MKRVVIIQLIIALVIGISVSIGPAQTPTAKVYKIGVSCPLSGGAMEGGIRVQRACDMIIDDINKAGGIKVGKDTYMFKQYYADNKYTTEGGVDAAKKLILGDKVNFITAWGTVSFLATEGVSVPAKVLQMGLGTPETCLGPKYPHVFRVYNTGNHFIPAAAVWFAQKYPQYKTWKYINPHSPLEMEGAIQIAGIGANYGKKVFNPFFWDVEIQDYSPVVAAVMVDNPEALLVQWLSYGPGAGLLIKQLREAGWKGQIVGFTTPTTAAIEIGGKKNVEGLLGIGLDPYSEFTPKGVREWGKRYEKKYAPDILSMWPATLIPEIEIMAQALQKAGSIDSDKVKAVLESGVTFKTVWGPLQFGLAEVYGVPHQCITPQVIVRIGDDGKEHGLAVISVEQTTKDYLQWRIKK